MTLGELKTLLEELEQEHELTDETEVRFAGQPTYPFEYSLAPEGVVFEGVIYLSEHDQIGYLPGEVTSLLGWRR